IPGSTAPGCQRNENNRSGCICSIFISNEMPSYGFCILATSWLTVVGTITAVKVAPGEKGELKRIPNQLPNSVESERARQTRFSGARRRIVFSIRSVDVCNLLVAY